MLGKVEEVRRNLNWRKAHSLPGKYCKLGKISYSITIVTRYSYMYHLGRMLSDNTLKKIQSQNALWNRPQFESTRPKLLEGILGERRINSKVYCIHLIPSDCADFLLQRKLCASSVEYPCKVQSVKKKEWSKTQIVDE